MSSIQPNKNNNNFCNSMEWSSQSTSSTSKESTVIMDLTAARECLTTLPSELVVIIHIYANTLGTVINKLGEMPTPTSRVMNLLGGDKYISELEIEDVHVSNESEGMTIWRQITIDRNILRYMGKSLPPIFFEIAYKYWQTGADEYRKLETAFYSEKSFGKKFITFFNNDWYAKHIRPTINKMENNQEGCKELIRSVHDYYQTVPLGRIGSVNWLAQKVINRCCGGWRKNPEDTIPTPAQYKKYKIIELNMVIEIGRHMPELLKGISQMDVIFLNNCVYWDIYDRVINNVLQGRSYNSILFYNKILNNEINDVFSCFQVRKERSTTSRIDISAYPPPKKGNKRPHNDISK